MVRYTLMWEIQTIKVDDYPALLHEIPDPPTELWGVGVLPPPQLKLIAVVGSRKYTRYGKEVVSALINDLADAPVGIISGLAIGIDTLAHEAALANGLYTLAIPGSGLDPSVLYPRRNQRLARRIVEQGGGLLSELSPDTKAARWTFPQRNRLMAGISHATLLIEASERSGTLITARLAADYNRDVLAVPGSIFSPQSVGTNQFIQLGATPITSGRDILAELGLSIDTPTTSHTPELTELESKVLNLLADPHDLDSLQQATGLPVTELGSLLMRLELHDLIWSDRGHYQQKNRT